MRRPPIDAGVVRRHESVPPRLARDDKTMMLVATRCIDFVVQYGNCEVEPLQLQCDCRTAIFVSLGRSDETVESGFSAAYTGSASRPTIA